MPPSITDGKPVNIPGGRGPDILGILPLPSFLTYGPGTLAPPPNPFIMPPLCVLIGPTPPGKPIPGMPGMPIAGFHPAGIAPGANICVRAFGGTIGKPMGFM